MLQKFHDKDFLDLPVINIILHLICLCVPHSLSPLNLLEPFQNYIQMS